MQIRKEQLAAFEENLRRLFVERLASDVCRLYPDAVSGVSFETVKDVVADGVRRAEAYGITWQSALADFVGLMFDVGLKFDEHPTVRRLLNDPATPPNLRVRKLIRVLNAAQWNNVRGRAARSRLPTRGSKS